MWDLVGEHYPWLHRPEDRCGEINQAPGLSIDGLRALIGSLCHPEVRDIIVKLLAPTLRRELGHARE